jgi:phage terminase large subunit-like protein
MLRWMAGNVTVETDAAENIKPSKAKSTERIDDVVALVIAIERAMRAEEPGMLMYIPGEEANTA